jgi:microcystin-dependent protein
MSDNTSTIALILSMVLCFVVAAIVNKVFLTKSECPEQCPAGPAGPRGIKGDQGEVGPEGPKGSKGDQGDKGDIGSKGPKGDKGEQGIQGEKGDQGIPGQKGEQGVQGLLGPVGIQGPAGKDGSIVLSDSGGNPLGNYYDKNSVDNLLKPLALQSQVDTAYVRKTDVYDKTASDNKFALKSALPDLSPYAKTSDVSLNYALKTALPDLTPYARTADVSSTYALKTALPDLTPYARTADVNKLLESKAPINNPTFTGTVGGITKAMIGLGNVDNTTDLLKPVSTATTTALGLKANLESPVFTGTVGGITKAMVGLGNVDNTTDAGKPVSTATTTALGLKANLANPVFTGTVGGITKEMVGLDKVDNTTDLLKPVSTATTTALNLKANLANPTFSGTVGGITKAMVGLGDVDNTSDRNKPTSDATARDYIRGKDFVDIVTLESVPIGTILTHTSSSIPSQFVLCDGAEYDKVGKYEKLFAVIGTSYGTPSVATKFRVPDIRSRTIVGTDAQLLGTKVLGSTGGAETVTVNSTGTLALANIPVHNHTVSLSSEGMHSNVTAASSSGTYTAADGNAYKGYGTPGNVSTGVNATVVSVPGHTHTATVGNAGSGTAFSATANNVSVMQPYITLNYIIKFTDFNKLMADKAAATTATTSTTAVKPVAENYSYFGVF